jgi:thioredoxin reductase (NADPH)
MIYHASAVDHTHDLIIVGGGPSGLAAAIAAHQAHLDYVVLEKGTLVDSIFRFPVHMVFFTTPELLEIGGLPFVTPYEKPTRIEALRYYRRVVDTYGLRLELNRKVTAIEPNGAGFTVRADDDERRSRFVVLAIGYYDNPNFLEIPGEDLPHVSHYYTEPHPYYRKRVVVAGGKNSAAIAALELYRAGARVTLVHRRDRLSDSIKYWIRPDIENRIKEGSIEARLQTRITAIRPGSATLERDGAPEEVAADAVFLLTGYHPDVSLLAGAGVRIDPATCAPEHDPASFETNVPGLFVAGAVVTGKETNRIFIENGRFHGDTVVARIVERLRADSP